MPFELPSGVNRIQVHRKRKLQVIVLNFSVSRHEISIEAAICIQWSIASTQINRFLCQFTLQILLFFIESRQSATRTVCSGPEPNAIEWKQFTLGVLRWLRLLLPARGSTQFYHCCWCALHATDTSIVHCSGAIRTTFSQLNPIFAFVFNFSISYMLKQNSIIYLRPFHRLRRFRYIFNIWKEKNI